MTISRRRILQVGGSAAGVLAAGGVAYKKWGNAGTQLSYEFPALDGASVLTATPSCQEISTTVQQIEGPFYTPNTPLRTSLREANIVGTPLVIEGRVLYTDCSPIVGAVLDVWSCDGQGVYDNDGFGLRGHQFTDAQGAFRIETVKPGDYWQSFIHRTPHIHVKVQGRDTALLTTQLYFPGEPLNQQDIIINHSLVMKLDQIADGTLRALFDFVLPRRAVD